MKWPQEAPLKLRDQPRHEARACFCIGPQNGEPVCPCKMRAYTEREMGRRVLDKLLRGFTPAIKPRIRVKAGGRTI